MEAVVIILASILFVAFLIGMGVSSRDDKCTSSKVKSNSINSNIYQKKKYWLTNAERIFFARLRQIVNTDRYEIIPQVNLATVIYKYGSRYQNELYRNIDYCIFDREYKPLVLIELNDSSHNKQDRIERDYKVTQICKLARIPLLKFTLDTPLTEVKTSIEKELNNYL